MDQNGLKVVWLDSPEFGDGPSAIQYFFPSLSL
jgi:hypothetical protein